MRKKNADLSEIFRRSVREKPCHARPRVEDRTLEGGEVHGDGFLGRKVDGIDPLSIVFVIERKIESYATFRRHLQSDPRQSVYFAVKIIYLFPLRSSVDRSDCLLQSENAIDPIFAGLVAILKLFDLFLRTDDPRGIVLHLVFDLSLLFKNVGYDRHLSVFRRTEKIPAVFPAGVIYDSLLFLERLDFFREELLRIVPFRYPFENLPHFVDRDVREIFPEELFPETERDLSRGMEIEV